MPVTEMIVIIASFSALLIGAIHVVRLIGLYIVHRTVRRAIDREPASAQPLLDKLTAADTEKPGDDRTGVLLVAFGAAMVAATVIAGDQSWMRYGIGGAMFPLIVGAALWARAYYVERARLRGAG